jgi:colanic acid biosynthesis glycosyl transferase WcaI
MRIVVHSIFYRPDLTGVAKYTTEMCEWLAARGHDITVIAPPPYFPQWRVRPPYRPWKYVSELLDGVRVWRSPLWVPRKPRGLNRILYSLSFFLFSLPLAVAAAVRLPDVIVAVEPSLFSAISAWMTARLTGSALWLHIQDYEVDLAFDLGQLRWGRRWAQAFESWLMGRFDIVSSITARMLEKAHAKGVREERLTLLPNWFDPDTICPYTGEARIRRELGVGPLEVIVLFAGSLGAKQGLEVLVDAARSTPGAVFVVCGEGVMAERLRSRASDLTNVKFLPLQPAQRLNELLNTADIHALPQDPSASGSVMPSKIIGMLASGRPIVAAAARGTEIAELIEGCGVRVNPGDCSAFSRAVIDLADSLTERRRLGEAGRRRALSMFRSAVILPHLESEMKRLAKGELPKGASRFAAE